MVAMTLETTTKEELKVLYLIDGLGLGGAERMMLPILKNLRKAGVNVRVCAMYVRDGNPIQQELENAGIPVDVLGITRLKTPTNLPRLLNYLRATRPDLLHTQLEFSNTLGSIAGKFLGIPTVSTQHTYDAPTAGSRSNKRLQLMWRSLRHFSDRVIGVSNGTSQHHIEAGNLDPRKVTTIYNGIELNRFAPFNAQKRADGRTALAIQPEAFLMITVAVLREPKGIQYMLSALPDVLKAIPNAHYLIVGGGEYEDALKAQVEQLNLGEHVTFTGVRRDVPELLPLADLFVHPTLDDALPTVLIEAMATQLPIVASAVGGVPEMVIDQNNGLLSKPANPDSLAEKVIYVGQNCRIGQAMGRRGKQIAEERFNVTGQTEQLLQLYQQLARRRMLTNA